MRNTLWLLLCLALPVAAQERFSPFVPSVEQDVERMLRFAGLRDGDVVVDLGSGDGRIVLQAARMHPRVRGRGIEIDEKLVRQSRATVQASGLDKRVEILHQNAFDADLKDATVITMWLWPEVMRMLRPKIMAEARPGTRVLAMMWDLGSWKHDELEDQSHRIYKWIVPAAVAGQWRWDSMVAGARVPYSVVLEQAFQAVEGVVRAGDRRGVLNDVKLTGDQLAFTLLMTMDGAGMVRQSFEGRVDGDAITGTVTTLTEPYEKEVVAPWRAQRVNASSYFAATGLEAR